jgi:hypothetical protein
VWDRFFRPSGVGGFYSNSSPTCAMGYDLSPSSRAAKPGRYCSASGERCRLITAGAKRNSAVSVHSGSTQRRASPCASLVWD